MHSINVLAVKIFFYLSLHAGIPVVLDGVVCPARQAFCYVSPAITCAVLLGLKYDAVLVLGPRRLGDVWVQVIMPSLSTLLANPPCVRSIDGVNDSILF